MVEHVLKSPEDTNVIVHITIVESTVKVKIKISYWFFFKYHNDKMDQYFQITFVIRHRAKTLEHVLKKMEHFDVFVVLVIMDIIVNVNIVERCFIA